MVLATAWALSLAGCGSFADEPACPTLPPGAEVSPLPSSKPCDDMEIDGP